MTEEKTAVEEQAEKLAEGAPDGPHPEGIAEGEDMGPSGTSADGGQQDAGDDAPLREEDVRESDGLDDRVEEETLPGDGDE